MGCSRSLHKRKLAQENDEAQLRHQALNDELTGLPNRRLLADRLSQALDLARRDLSKAGLLFVDLDGFKLVNE